MARRLCLITGASAGIGMALARIYAREGWDLALVARRTGRLAALAGKLAQTHGATCIVIGEDLSDPGAPERIIERIRADGRPVEALVNNAGYGGPGGFTKSSWKDEGAFLQVMTDGPLRLCHLVLPGMIERGYGRILNVASLAGMVPPALGQGLYGAVKAYLIEASRALHAETKGTGVHVTALCPGLTRTEFHEVAKLTKAAARAPAFAWQSAEEVAEAGYAACEANAAVRVPGLVNKTAAAVFKILPDAAGMAIMRRASRGWEKDSQ